MNFLRLKRSRPLSSPRRVAALICAVLFWAFNICLAFSNLIAINRLPDIAPPIVPDMVVYQSTDYSCGPASLSTLFRYYNIIYSEREWAELAGTNLAVGTRLAGLIQAGRNFGFETVELSPTFDQLRYIFLPSILFNSREYHLVSFWGLDDTNRAIIRDPVLGVTKWDAGKYGENTPCDPILLVFYPGQVPTCDIDSPPREIVRSQNMLSVTGHYHGKVNGTWDTNLTRAVMSFQSDMGLEPTGIVDPATSIFLEGAWRHNAHGTIGPFLMTDRNSSTDTGVYVFHSQINSE